MGKETLLGRHARSIADEGSLAVVWATASGGRTTPSRWGGCNLEALCSCLTSSGRRYVNVGTCLLLILWRSGLCLSTGAHHVTGRKAPASVWLFRLFRLW